MNKLTPVEFDALTRIDFWIFVQRVFAELTGEPFADGFHIQLLCSVVDRVRTEDSVRLAVALPPRSLKSIIISVALTAWLLGHDPGLEIVCVSYGQELADKLAADARRVMQAPWYRRLFPRTVLDRTAVSHLATTEGGKRYATSVGGALTGIGADVIIVDDPMKPDEALSDAERNRTNGWARHTLFTRLNNKAKDRIIVVQQRLHEDDMIGHVMDRAGFELLSFPAIAQEDEHHVIRTPFGTLVHDRKEGEALHPEREPLWVLERQMALLGTDYFAAQYLQSPTPLGGGIVKTEWFGRYDLTNMPRFKRIVQSWDCASKHSELSDYSVCTTWGINHQNQVFLIHVFRGRLTHGELEHKVRELANLYKAGTVLIEETAAGVYLVQQLKHAGFARVIPVKPKGDKVMRMHAQSALIEGGRVFIPREAPWREAFLHELAMFPKGKYDDQVDSVSQALAYIGQGSPFDALIEMMQSRALSDYGLTPEDLTIVFDCADRDWEFKGVGGRPIRRETDGFYRAAAREWVGIQGQTGVTLIEDWGDDPKS